MNKPEEYTEMEKHASSEAAKVAELMMKKPRSRWILRPLYRMFKWCEAQCDMALKEDGWR